MKDLIFILLAVVFFSCQPDAERSEAHFRNLNELLQQTDFFSAADGYDSLAAEMTPFHRDLTEAFLFNGFNKLEASNQKIARLLGRYRKELPDTLIIQLYRMQQENHSRLFAYREAASSLANLLEEYSQLLDSATLAGYHNSLSLWQALQQVPPQEVIMDADLHTQMVRDVAGLNNLRVTRGEETELFIFDTGANLSTVSLSTARRFGMQLIDAAIEVGTITGKKVPAKLAVADHLMIEGAELRNVVFLVMDDELLSFPQANYVIHGILGFPVIEAFGEVQMTRSGEFLVPLHPAASTQPPNMALNHLSPLIRIDGRHYNFDSGADHTMLYKRYLDENRAAVEASWQPDSLGFGGAGGRVTIPGYKGDFPLTIGGQSIILEDISLLGEDINEKWSKVYGNIGQDLITRFEKMSMNFRDMVIRFE